MRGKHFWSRRRVRHKGYKQRSLLNRRQVLSLESLENRCLLSIAPGDFSPEELYLPPTSTAIEYGGFLSEPASGSAMDIAIDYLEDNAGQFGLNANDLKHYVVTDQYSSDDTGTTHIYLGQTFNDLPVSNAKININITDDGRVLYVGSSFVPGLDYPATPTAPEPAISASEALENFASELGVTFDVSPQIISAPAGSNQSMVLSSGLSDAPVNAELRYVPVASGGVELAWLMSVVTDVGGLHWYDTHVSALDGNVLYTSDRVWEASYDAVPYSQESIDEGGRAVIVDPQDLTASPYGWHNINGGPGNDFTDTRGNNTFTQSGRNISSTDVVVFTAAGLGGSIATGPRPDGGSQLNFDFPVDLHQQPESYEDAAVTNLFYMMNVLHDVHYQYGFDEEAGNFQFNNFSQGGVGSDEMIAFAQLGANLGLGDTNNAFLVAAPEGQNPSISMLEWDTDFTDFSPLNTHRDADLDNGIIVHEYGHGVSTRLVGGPSDIGALAPFDQPGGMGEGWSDWWALMFNMAADPDVAEYIVTYVQGQDPAEGPGIRNFPYSTDMSINPLTYNYFNLSNWLNAPNPSGSPGSETHNAGEIWASTLWDMTWLLINGDGDQIAGQGYDPDIYHGTGGNNLALQLVMDGMKLAPNSPTFLDGRDAILAADMALTGGENQLAIWTAFARRGMGYSAQDFVATQIFPVFQSIVDEAFDMPPDLVPSPGIIRVTGTVFQDANADGVRSTGEIGAGGLTVFLDANDNGELNVGERSTTTAADGSYLFSYVEPGISVAVQVPDGFFQTLPMTGASLVVTGQVGDFVSGLDFGVSPIVPGVVSGVKWQDLDGDGEHDANEPGLANVFIYADLDDSGSINVGEPSVRTAADGSYQLELAPGDYMIREVVGVGSAQTFPGAPEFGYQVTVSAGETITGIDFGNMEARDYGDLPDSYGTLAENGGPSHGVSAGFRLGASVDAEIDGVPTIDADGDDNNNLRDDDGVLFASGLAYGETAQIVVYASNSVGYLNVWLDLNANGNFNDAGEKIISGRLLSTGANTITFTLPAAPVGVDDGVTTYARFRYGVEPSIGPGGPALFGEVEDYQIQIPMEPDTGLRAVDDEFNVNEDVVAFPLNVLANDSTGPLGGTLMVTEVSGFSAGGAATISGGTTVLYTPPADFFGDETFTYTLEDGEGGVKQAEVTVHVAPINDPPTANDDEYDVAIGSIAFLLDVLANDTTLPETGETLRITSVISPPNQGGQVDLTNNNTAFFYTPAPTFAGTETFTYQITDGNGGFDTATVTLHVQQLDPIVEVSLELTDELGTPIDTVDIGQVFQVRAYVEDLRAAASGVFSSYFDLTYDAGLVSVNTTDTANPLGFDIEFGANYANRHRGDASVAGLINEVGATDGSSELGGEPTLLFVVDFTANSAGTFLFETDPADSQDNETNLFDGSNTVAASQILFGSLEVTIEGFAAIPDNPDVDEDSIDFPLDVLANDSQVPNGPPLTLESVTDPANGSAVISNNVVLYSPNPDFFGTDTFMYTVSNGLGETRQALVTVNVKNVNDDPDAVDDPVEVFENTTALLDVLANDTFLPDPPETLTITNVGTPDMGGTATIMSNQIQYMPAADFVGTETFTYTIGDGNGGSDTATVTVTVKMNPDARPLAVEDAYLGDEAVDEESDNVLDVLDNDLASPSGTLVITDVGSASNGGTVTTDGAFVYYTPADDFFGTETFSYTIEDGVGLPSTTTVTVEVLNVNDNPDAVDDQREVGLNSTNNQIDVLANDTYLPDPPETLTITNVGTPDHGGMATIAGDQILYTPATDFIGTEEFTYTISDGNGGSDTATVTVDVGLADLILIGVRAKNLSGDVITEIQVGQTFVLQGYVMDKRLVDADGVFSAYADVEYDPDLVTADGDTIVHGAEYMDRPRGTINPPGTLDEFGGAHLQSGTLGAGEFELFTIEFTADVSGTAEFTLNGPDDPANEVLLINSTTLIGENQIEFVDWTLTVTEDGGSALAYHNANNPLDVNNDGRVSLFDALILVNELNANESSAASESASAATQAGDFYYWDVSGDDRLSLMDALLLFNYLNSEGDAASALAASSASSAVSSALAESSGASDAVADSLAQTAEPTYALADQAAILVEPGVSASEPTVVLSDTAGISSVASTLFSASAVSAAALRAASVSDSLFSGALPGALAESSGAGRLASAVESQWMEDGRGADWWASRSEESGSTLQEDNVIAAPPIDVALGRRLDGPTPDRDLLDALLFEDLAARRHGTEQGMGMLDPLLDEIADDVTVAFYEDVA